MKKGVLIMAKSKQFVAKDLVERGCMANDVCAKTSVPQQGKFKIYN